MSDDTRTSTTELPPKVVMPLLDYITAHSLDEDYAAAARRDVAPGRQTPVRPGLAALVIMGIFGLLVATAGLQTARNADAASGGRNSIVNQIEARSAQVDARRARADDLRLEVATLQSTYLETTAQGRLLSARLERLGIATGAVAVQGPGVKVVVDDAPDPGSDQEVVFDEDLQKLANALWAAGAEAISVNGQRLTNLSAIRKAGDSITVNFTSISPPYTFLAVGNPDTMPARFVDTAHGRDWLDLHSIYGLRFDMTEEESMRLPAVPARRINLRHATERETQ